jgi:predicted RecA/RadA family phage recombinase
MATNYIQPGKIMEFTAPVGGVVSGNGYVIGSLFVVATNDADAGDTFRGAVGEVWALPKTAALALTEGQLVYWDTATNAIVGAPGATARRIGCAAAAAAGADATAAIRLSGVPSPVNVA